VKKKYNTSPTLAGVTVRKFRYSNICYTRDIFVRANASTVRKKQQAK
jgi:hypothetical protein